jgi:RNA polymerase sigma-70 factor, ECF subfamily
MVSANSYTGLDPRVVRSLRYHARRLSGRIPRMDLADLEQCFALHVLSRLNFYDGRRADLGTFTDRILTNLARNLVTAAYAEKRTADRTACSIEDVDPCGPSVGLPLSPGTHDSDWEEQIHLRRDVERIVSELPPQLQEICSWLSCGSVTDASRRSGLSRPSIYGRIERVRRAFKRAGLEQYVRPTPTSSFGASASPASRPI